jgi:hypothetical protein
MPESEVRLAVEREDQVPVHGAGKQPVVVHTDVPRGVAAGALLHLGAEAEDERELEPQRLELLLLAPRVVVVGRPLAADVVPVG